MRQYGLITERANGPPPRALTFAVTELFVPIPLSGAPTSGRAARTPHPSANRRPVLVPPCTDNPLRSRAFTEMSTPCQFSDCSPNLLEACASSSTCPTFVGTRLYSPLIN